MNVPHEVGGFVLEHELGRGGMGVVYRARDPRLDRPVALKVILGDPSPQERERSRTRSPSGRATPRATPAAAKDERREEWIREEATGDSGFGGVAWGAAPAKVMAPFSASGRAI